MSLPGEDDKDARIPPYGGASPLESPARARSSDPKPTSYRECLKNHAASRGGNVTDGCGEFMPGGDDGTLEALKCAACGCHRNFHRKEQHHGGDPAAHHHHIHSHLLHHRAATAWGSVVQPLKVAYGGGGGTDSSSEELNFNPYRSGAVAPPPPQFGSGRKRFRTKFTPEQKERMLEFAERLGWRIPREDDAEIQRFCAEVGVKRQVFKVWMHNNKTLSASKKNSEPLM